MYWLLTASTAVRVLSELGAVLGGLGQLTAALVFVVNMWTRVRMPGAVGLPRSLDP